MPLMVQDVPLSPDFLLLPQGWDRKSYPACKALSSLSLMLKGIIPAWPSTVPLLSCSMEWDVEQVSDVLLYQLREEVGRIRVGKVRQPCTTAIACEPYRCDIVCLAPHTAHQCGFASMPSTCSKRSPFTMGLLFRGGTKGPKHQKSLLHL